MAKRIYSSRNGVSKNMVDGDRFELYKQSPFVFFCFNNGTAKQARVHVYLSCLVRPRIATLLLLCIIDYLFLLFTVVLNFVTSRFKISFKGYLRMSKHCIRDKKNMFSEPYL